MVSVTSEVLANASVQSASARSARPDPSPPAGNDSFASLIDSNASHSDNRAQANSQTNSQDNSPGRVTGDPPPGAPTIRRAASDSRSRDTAAASDNAPRNRLWMIAIPPSTPATTPMPSAKSDAPRSQIEIRHVEVR